jgi:nitrite reductase/ring-hydroxylating ferredoxin subunit
MHGSQFDVSTGKVVRGPANQTLKTFRVSVEGEIGRVEEAPSAVTATTKSETRQLEENEFRTNEIAPGETLLVQVEGGVAVYNVGGVFYATQDECPHAGGPLSEGKLDGKIITCPWHGSCFDVITGEVRRGPATKPTKTFRVTVEGEIGRVEKNP